MPPVRAQQPTAVPYLLTTFRFQISLYPVPYMYDLCLLVFCNLLFGAATKSPPEVAFPSQSWSSSMKFSIQNFFFSYCSIIHSGYMIGQLQSLELNIFHENYHQTSQGLRFLPQVLSPEAEAVSVHNTIFVIIKVFYLPTDAQ